MGRAVAGERARDEVHEVSQSVVSAKLMRVMTDWPRAQVHLPGSPSWQNERHFSLMAMFCF